MDEKHWNFFTTTVPFPSCRYEDVAADDILLETAPSRMSRSVVLCNACKDFSTKRFSFVLDRGSSVEALFELFP